MIKKVIMMFSILFLLVFNFSSTAIVFGQESATPELLMRLNPDKTSSMTLTLNVGQENIDQYVEQYTQILEPEGYTVSKSEDSSSMILNKTFLAEDGYLVDLSLFGVGIINFVEFNDLFCNRYGIKSTAFNSENMPEGQDYLLLTIETPVKATHSNATMQENGGKINTWKISSGQKNEIYLTFKEYSMFPILVAVFIVILLVALYFIAKANKKKRNFEFNSPVTLTASDDGLNAETGYSEDENTIELLNEIEFDNSGSYHEENNIYYDVEYKKEDEEEI